MVTVKFKEMHVIKTHHKQTAEMISLLKSLHLHTSSTIINQQIKYPLQNLQLPQRCIVSLITNTATAKLCD